MPTLTADRVDAVLRKGTSARVDAEVPARFKPGDTVLARNMHPIGHTRIPRYVRGKRGTVDRDHGVFIFPDAHAAGRGKQPQHCYSVRFEAREVWGEQDTGRGAVYLDLWDDYLDPA